MKRITSLTTIFLLALPWLIQAQNWDEFESVAADPDAFFEGQEPKMQGFRGLHHSSGMDRLIVYIHDLGANWHWHDHRGHLPFPSEPDLRLEMDGVQVSFNTQEPLFTQKVSEDQPYYYFDLPKDALKDVQAIHFLGKRLEVEFDGEEPLMYVSIFNTFLFPEAVEFFTEAEIQRWSHNEPSRLEGEIEIREGLTGQLKSKIELHLPIADWDGKKSFLAEVEVQPNWRRATFSLEFPVQFPTLAFIEYRERFYPILVEPDDYTEFSLNWDTLADGFNVRETDSHRWHHEHSQYFFQHRYPNGLAWKDMQRLVYVFSGDLARRGDTLIAWSREAETFFGRHHGYVDDFMARLNEVGRHTDKDRFEQGYEAYREVQSILGWSWWENLQVFLGMGLALAAIAFVGIIVLRLFRSPIASESRLNVIEASFYGMLAANILVQALIFSHDGIIQTSRFVDWVWMGLPISYFYLNFRFLVPEYLLKRRWGMFLLLTLGISFGMALFGAFITAFPAAHYGLWLVNGDWYFMNQFSENGPVGHADAMFGLHLFLLAGGIFYGLGRHGLLNLMPKLKEQKEALNAELHQLKSQISPHFFFNSLNTVYGFALAEDSPKTAEAITQLSSLMRFAIYEGDQPTIPLETELEYLSDYIELQRLRLDPSKHDLHFQIEGDPGQLRIAPLLLITLVENAFKHGISMSRPSYIHINLLVQEQGMILSVENSTHEGQLAAVGAGQPTTGGLGLVNTQQRLNLMYKGRYDWQIVETDECYRTQLSIDLD
ncbi:MAG: sensor histidine kinase [Bacteroidota bacterium]